MGDNEGIIVPCSPAQCVCQEGSVGGNAVDSESNRKVCRQYGTGASRNRAKMALIGDFYDLA